MIKERKGTKALIVVMCMLNNVIMSGLVISSFATLLPEITADLGWDTMQMASIVGAVSMGIFISVFIAGMLLDKFKPKILMVIAVLLGAVAVACRALANDFAFFYAIMMLLGVSTAIFTPGGNKILTYWFDNKNLLKVYALLISGAAIGSFVGYNITLPFVAAVDGWRNMYLIYGLIIAVMSVIWIVFIPNRSEKDSALNKELGVDVDNLTFGQKMKDVLKSKQTWLCCIAEMTFFGAILTFLGLGPTVFSSWPGLDVQTAATITSMANFGSMFGYWTLPAISDKVGLRKPFIGPSMICSVIIWMCALLCQNIVLAMVLTFIGGFLNGFGCSGPRTVLVESKEIAGARAGTALGLMNTLFRLGNVLFPLLFAGVLETVGTPSLALCIVMAFGFVAAVCMLTVRETGPKAKDKRKKAEQIITEE